MKISYRSIFPATSAKGFSTHLLIQLNVQLWFLVLELFSFLVADSRLWWSQECQTLKHLRIAIIFCVRRLFIKGDWLTCERCNNSISPFSFKIWLGIFSNRFEFVQTIATTMSLKRVTIACFCHVSWWPSTCYIFVTALSYFTTSSNWFVCLFSIAVY